MKVFVGLIVVVSCLKIAHALKCYGCSISEKDVDMDTSCMTENATVINCNKPWCVTIRQEYLDPRGKLQSLYKGCQEKPQYVNDIIEDETFRTYYYGCQSDLCNKGPGKDTSEEKHYLGDKSTIYCPGTGAASTVIAFTSQVLLLASVTMLL